MIRSAAMSEPTPEDQAAAVKAALFGGRKIEAIKIYRAQRNVGLFEAKTAVEQLEAELRQSMPGSFTAARAKGCGVTMLMVALLVAALCVMQGMNRA
jgi:ribosomal protein L7/L12